MWQINPHPIHRRLLEESETPDVLSIPIARTKTQASWVGIQHPLLTRRTKISTLTA